jgi:hypothetical protein
VQASISRQFGSRTPRTDAGFVLGGSVAILLLIYAVLLWLGWPVNSQMTGGPGGQAIDAAAFAVAGLLIVRRQPGTTIGLILIGVAMFLLTSADAQLYLLLDYHVRGGGLPLGRLAAALSPLWAGAIALVPPLMMLLPDGRPISPGWRKAAWASAVLTMAFLVLLAMVVASALWEDPLVVSPSGDLAVVADPSGWSGTVYWVSQALLIAALLIGHPGSSVSNSSGFCSEVPCSSPRSSGCRSWCRQRLVPTARVHGHSSGASSSPSRWLPCRSESESGCCGMTCTTSIALSFER